MAQDVTGLRPKIPTRALTPPGLQNEQQAIDPVIDPSNEQRAQKGVKHGIVLGSFEHARYKCSAWFAKGTDACLNMRQQDRSTICSIYFSD